MATVIGTVQGIDGKFFAKDANGNIVELKNGDAITQDMTVFGDKSNPESATIKIAIVDGGEIVSINGTQEQLFESYLNNTDGVDATLAQESVSGAEGILAALEDSEKATEDGVDEETAAGEDNPTGTSLADVFLARDGDATDVSTDLNSAQFAAGGAGAQGIPFVEEIVTTGDATIELTEERSPGDELNSFYGRLVLSNENTGDTFTFEMVPGSLAITDTNGVMDFAEDDIEVILNPDGTFSMVGNFNDLSDDESATVTFDYTARDQNGNALNTSTVTFNVGGTNDRPEIEAINLNGEGEGEEVLIDFNDLPYGTVDLYQGFDFTSEGSYYSTYADFHYNSGGTVYNGWAGKESHITWTGEGAISINSLDIKDWSGLDSVTFNGYLDGALIYTQDVPLTGTFKTIDLDFIGIDDLEIIAHGTYDGMGVEDTGWFLMDNLVYADSVGGKLYETHDDTDEPLVDDTEGEEPNSFTGVLAVTDDDDMNEHEFRLVEDSLVITDPSNAGIDAEDVSVSISLNEGTGEWEYNITGDFGELAAGETSTVTFQYVADDMRGFVEGDPVHENSVSEPATITLTITGTNDQPIIDKIDANVSMYDVNHTDGLTVSGYGTHNTRAIVTTDDEDGWGINSISDRNDSIESGSRASDKIVFEFDNAVSNAVVELSSFGRVDEAVWEAFNANGDLVNSGILDGANLNNFINISGNGDSIDKIEITAGDGRASQFFVKSIQTNTVIYETHDDNAYQNGVDDTQDDVDTIFEGNLATVVDNDTNDTHTYQTEGDISVDAPSIDNGLITDLGVVITDDVAGDYTVTGNFNALAAGETATVTFDYVAVDSSVNQTEGESNTSEPKTVTLTITGTNDQPIVQDINANGEEIQGDELGANLIINGSFEDHGDTSNYSYAGWGNMVTDMPGWTDAGGQGKVEAVSENYVSAPDTDGTYMVDMAASPGNMTLTQTVSGLEDGTLYKLSFDISQNDNTASNNEIEVFWNGDSVGTYNPTSGSMETISLDLNAIGGDNVLSFVEVGIVDSSSTYLDNIQLQEYLSSSTAIYESNDETDVIGAIDTQEDTNTVITGTITPATDDDVNDTHTYEVVEGTVSGLPDGATVIITQNATTGDWEYTVSGDFNYLDINEEATITFDYVAIDDSEVGANGDAHNESDRSEPATITLTLTGTNDQPIVSGDTVVISEESLLGAEDDIDSQFEDFRYEGTVAGTVSDDDNNDGGSNTHTFAIDDGTLNISITTDNQALLSLFTITDLGTLEAIVDSFHGGTVLDMSFLNVDGDGDVADSVTVATTANIPQSHIEVLENMGLLTISMAADGSYIVESPLFNLLGAHDSVTLDFDYRATDNAGVTDSSGVNELSESEAATVSLTIQGTNDQPVATPAEYRSLESSLEDDTIGGINALFSGDLPGAATGSVLGDIFTREGMDEDVFDRATLKFYGVDADADGVIDATTDVTERAPNDGVDVIDTSLTVVTVNEDGTFTVENPTFDNLSNGERATVTFEYYIDDKSGAVSTADTPEEEAVDNLHENTQSLPVQVTVTIIGTNDQPIVEPVFVTETESHDNIPVIPGTDPYQNGENDTQDDVLTTVTGTLTAADDDVNNTHVFDVKDYAASDYYGQGNGGPGHNGDQGDVRFDDVDFFKHVVAHPNASHNVKVMITSEDVDVANLDVESLALSSNGGNDSVANFELLGDFNALGMGETATVTFKYAATDTEGFGVNGNANNEASWSEPKLVTITIIGSNDQPIIEISEEPFNVIETDLTDVSYGADRDADLTVIASAAQEGSALKGVFDTAEGDTISFDWDFASMDFAFDAASVVVDGVIVGTVNTGSGVTSGTFTTDALSAGEHTITVLVVNDRWDDGDTVYNAELTISNIVTDAVLISSDVFGEVDNTGPGTFVLSANSNLPVADLDAFIDTQVVTYENAILSGNLLYDELLTVTDDDDNDQHDFVELSDQIVTDITESHDDGSDIDLITTPVRVSLDADGNYVVVSSSFDKMGEGDSVTIKFDVQVQDDSGAGTGTPNDESSFSETKTVTMVITGTNDQPVIESINTLDAVMEADLSTIDIWGRENYYEVITQAELLGETTINDEDVNDSHTLELPNSVVGHHGGLVSQDANFEFDLANANGPDNPLYSNGVIQVTQDFLDWNTANGITVNAAPGDFLFFGAGLNNMGLGERATLTFDVVANDDTSGLNGGESNLSDPYTVTIDIAGTNDQPVVVDKTVYRLEATGDSDTVINAKFAIGTDEDVNDTLSYGVVGIGQNDSVTDVAGANYVRVTVPYDADGNGVYEGSVDIAVKLASGTEVDLNDIDITGITLNGGRNFTIEGDFNTLPQGENLLIKFLYNATDSSGAGAGDGVDETEVSENAMMTIRVRGTNDDATIITPNGQDEGEVAEDLIFTVDGDLDITDLDAGQAEFSTTTTFQGTTSSHGNYTYGTFTIGTDGAWLYTLTNSTAQELVLGETVIETYRVYSEDGTAFEDVAISIHGLDDRPEVTDVDMSVVESSLVDIPMEDIALIVAAGDPYSLENYVTDPDAGASHTFRQGNAPLGLTITNTNAEMLAAVASGDSTDIQNIVLDLVSTGPAAFALGNALDAFPQVDVNSLIQNFAMDLANPTVDLDTAVSNVNTTLISTGITLVINSTDGIVLTIPDASALEAEGLLNVNVQLNGGYAVTSPMFDHLSVDDAASVNFDYQATDNSGMVSTPALITVDIAGTNDQPVVSDATASAVEGDGVTTFDGQLLLTSDEDVNDTHTFAQSGIATATVDGVATDFGLSVVVDANGQYHVTGNFDTLSAGEDAVVTFDYVADDGRGYDGDLIHEDSVSAPRTITLTVTGTDDAPVVTTTIGDSLLFDGLNAEYYGVNTQISNLAQFRAIVDGNDPDATFVATDIDYGYGTGTVSQGTNLQNFLGTDAASLSTDPGNTSDGGIHIEGKVYLEAGIYNFQVRADDGYQVMIDGDSVAEYASNQGPTTRTHDSFEIESDGYYSVDMVWWDQGGEYVFEPVLSNDGGASYQTFSSDNFGFSRYAEVEPTDIANVAVFDNSSYVDSSDQAGDSWADAESDNIQATLTVQGHTVSTFTDESETGFQTALADVTTLVMPEAENANFTGLSSGAKDTIYDFVNDGGTLVLGGDGDSGDVSFLNEMFGWSLINSSNYSSNGGHPFNITPDAIGTSYEGAASSLPDNNGTYTISTASLPAGALNLYADGSNTAVFSVEVGAGTVVFLAYDWFNAAPAGSYDGGWLNILDIAVTDSIPTPDQILSVDDIDGGTVNLAALIASVAPDTVDSLDRIELSGRTEVNVSIAEVVNATDGDNELIITSDGGNNDIVNLGENITEVADQSATPAGFTSYEGTDGVDSVLITIEDTITTRVSIYGTAGDDTIVGTDANEAIFAGAGNDTITTSLGNDTIDGGDGFDTVIVADGTTLDFGLLDNIEQIDLSNGVNDILSNLSLDDVLDMTDGNNELIITGDAGDDVTAVDTTGWTAVSESSNAGTTTYEYSKDGSGDSITLTVDDQIDSTGM